MHIAEKGMHVVQCLLNTLLFSKSFFSSDFETKEKSPPYSKDGGYSWNNMHWERNYHQFTVDPR